MGARLRRRPRISDRSLLGGSMTDTGSIFDAAHRCADEGCIYHGQPTNGLSCRCHKSRETMLQEEVARLRSGLAQSTVLTHSRALAEELREYTAMKYAGDCKCGKCQLVPRALVERIYHTLNGTALTCNSVAVQRPSRIEGAGDIVDEAACLIWAELCPGMVMGDEDRTYYEAAAKSVLALAGNSVEPVRDASCGSGVEEDGTEIIFLDTNGDQHKIVYDIREDRHGLGSGWFL